MNQLIPAILAHDEKEFRERVALLEADFPMMQIDIMDGAFVPNRTWFDILKLRGLKTTAQFELHLMVMDPGHYIEEASDIASITRFIWHLETPIHHDALINRVHALNKEAGLAISPETPLEKLAPYVESLEEILVMGATPGFSGQKLNHQNIKRAEQIHSKWPSIPIGFDINVNVDTIPLLKKAGVTRFCAASAIFGSEDPLAEALKLQSLL
ncbi:hypothetical protein KKF59_03035 [Patescibacteria group bacterium]|nr:hypothetical protein [Patescibacteria group bacterium]MBU1034994.1 hypothetical protein [Patescibacteria group bacterium]MBU1629703.1 hypothetical protein [Patescibacteria group bacterium]MBU1908080.1 hypothetical protein [Patescibacteria group bacterium]